MCVESAETDDNDDAMRGKKRGRVSVPRNDLTRFLSLSKNKNFEFTEFIIKLNAQPTSLVDCTTTGHYITLIEEIYNYRRRDKVNLRF